MTPEQLDKAALKLGLLRGTPADDLIAFAAHREQIEYMYRVLEALDFGLGNQDPFNQEKEI
jgi:hypothetical protein